MCSASVPFLCCANVSDFCLFAEAILAIARTMRAGLVYRRGVPQCTLSVAQAKLCAVVSAVCLKILIANVTADILICVLVCARFFTTHGLVAMML